MVPINKVNTKNVRVMRVVDMYVMKGMNPSLFGNYKQLKTYFKLMYMKDGNPCLATVFFDVPTVDIVSGKVKKGTDILVEKFGDDELKYLGASDDWETLIQFGYPSNQLGILPSKLKEFSEGLEVDGVKRFEIDYSEVGEGVDIIYNGTEVGRVRINKDGTVSTDYYDAFGKKMTEDWLTSRGWKKVVTDGNVNWVKEA